MADDIASTLATFRGTALQKPLTDALRALAEKAKDGLTTEEVSSFVTPAEEQVAKLPDGTLKTNATNLLKGFKDNANALIKVGQSAQAALNGYVEIIEAETEEKAKEAAKKAQDAAPDFFTAIISLFLGLLGFSDEQIKQFTSAMTGAPAAEAAPAAPAAGETAAPATPAAPETPAPSSVLVTPGASSEALAALKLPPVRLTPPNPSLNTAKEASEMATLYRNGITQLEARKNEIDGKIKALPAAAVITAESVEKPSSSADYYQNLRTYHAQNERAELLGRVNEHYRAGMTGSAILPVNAGTFISHKEDIGDERIVVPIVDYGKNHGRKKGGALFLESNSYHTGNTILEDKAKAEGNATFAKTRLSEDNTAQAKEYGAYQQKLALKTAMDKGESINLADFEGLEQKITAAKEKITEGKAALEASGKKLGTAAQEEAKLHALLQVAADARERPGKYRQSTVAGLFSNDENSKNEIEDLERALGVKFVDNGAREGENYITIKGAEGKEMTFEVLEGGPYDIARKKFDGLAKTDAELRQGMMQQNAELGALEARKEVKDTITAYQLKAELADVEKGLSEAKTLLPEIERRRNELHEAEQAAEKARAEAARKAEHDAAFGSSGRVGAGGPSASAGEAVAAPLVSLGGNAAVAVQKTERTGAPIYSLEEGKRLEQLERKMENARRREANLAVRDERIGDRILAHEQNIGGIMDNAQQRAILGGDNRDLTSARKGSEVGIQLSEAERVSVGNQKAAAQETQAKLAAEMAEIHKNAKMRGQYKAATEELAQLEKSIQQTQDARNTLVGIVKQAEQLKTTIAEGVSGQALTPQEAAALKATLLAQAAEFEKAGVKIPGLVAAAQKVETLTRDEQGFTADDARSLKTDLEKLDLAGLLTAGVTAKDKELAAKNEQKAEIETDIDTYKGNLGPNKPELAPHEVFLASDQGLSRQQEADRRVEALNRKYHTAKTDRERISAFKDAQRIIDSGEASPEMTKRFLEAEATSAGGVSPSVARAEPRSTGPAAPTRT